VGQRDGLTKDLEKFNANQLGLRFSVLNPLDFMLCLQIEMILLKNLQNIKATKYIVFYIEKQIM
jgi:hypothetical protein